MIFTRSKEKAFVSEEKDWAVAGEDSDEEEFINMALLDTSEEQKASYTGSQGKTKNLWYLDSGCSRHMTGDSTLLTEFMERASPSITLEDDIKGYTIGYGLISKENVIIDSVALVDGLKHNLLSISQLCDKENEVWFTKEACIISNKNNMKHSSYWKHERECICSIF